VAGNSEGAFGRVAAISYKQFLFAKKGLAVTVIWGYAFPKQAMEMTEYGKGTLSRLTSPVFQARRAARPE
jgi:hypothetical protein